MRDLSNLPMQEPTNSGLSATWWKGPVSRALVKAEPSFDQTITICLLFVW